MSEANRTRVIDAVTEVVRDLGLDGIKGVYNRNRDKQGATEQYPSIEIRRNDGVDSEQRLTAEHDLVGYGVRLMFRYRDGAGPNSPVGRADAWHEKIAHAFRNRNNSTSGKLPDMSEVREVVIEPLPIGTIGRDSALMVEGGFIIRVFVVEQRG